MNTPTKEEFYAAVHCLAGYAAPHEKSLLADYDGTLGIRDASTEILKKAFAALEAAERAYGLLEEAHKSTTEKFADMMARVRELECVRDALIRSEESANQLEEMVSNQAREYLERAEAAEGKLEAAEADGARLDWLEKEAVDLSYIQRITLNETDAPLGPVFVAWGGDGNLRAVVDAARKEART